MIAADLTFVLMSILAACVYAAACLYAMLSTIELELVATPARVTIIFVALLAAPSVAEARNDRVCVNDWVSAKQRAIIVREVHRAGLRYTTNHKACDLHFVRSDDDRVMRLGHRHLALFWGGMWPAKARAPLKMWREMQQGGG